MEPIESVLKRIPAGTPKERALLLASWLCDRAKVREQGHNDGAYVRQFLASVGLGAGYPWCAAFVHFCLWQCGYPVPKTSTYFAAVKNWSQWASGRHTTKPSRGDLFYWLNSDGTGHIGFVVSTTGPWFRSIEGNTDADGSREGDGVYRKVRLLKGKRFIRL